MVLPDLHQLRFASDATMAALWGGLALLVAALAWWGDRRRLKRTEFDQVGWVPWTPLFFAALLVGGALISLAVKGWIDG